MNYKLRIVSILSLICSISLCSRYSQADFQIIRNSIPMCKLVVPEEPSIQEDFAIGELNLYIQKFTGQLLEIQPDSEPLSSDNLILIGTRDSNEYIDELVRSGAILWNENISEEEFIIKTINYEGRDVLVVAGSDGKGVIYGAYALAEKMIEYITTLSPVDLDFYISPIKSLFVDDLNIRSKPFYPIRCALSHENAMWMSRHRVNVSGAEGVWSGTGIDDGLGTAFKYVLSSRFGSMQDESLAKRQDRVTDLRERLISLNIKGIDPYLFMYVMGEPTKALERNHPELLEEAVQYQSSRNGTSYRPISWTKPEARELIRNLVKSIVKTYSPWLKGLHLRSWGWETRAPADNDEEQQKLLWEIYYDIVKAAHEIDPDFKFLISGYDQYWLHDPERVYAAQLPPKTIFMHKWGIDGEPSNDPAVKIEYINSIGELGHHILIFSHDTEEVMPLWMLEADLFVEGVRKYADNPGIIGLGGFTLQGNEGLAHLDKIISARIGWNPYENYAELIHNYFVNYYGVRAAKDLSIALRTNSLTMADYFSDYAGSLSLTGAYGEGSRGYATRFWNIIGPKAVEDTLSIPNLETAEYAEERFISLLPRQQESANAMAKVEDLVKLTTSQSMMQYRDGMHLMKMWVRFFESRLRLVEAREIGLRGGSLEQIVQKLASAIEYSKEMQMEIDEMVNFTNVFEYDDHLAKESLLEDIDAEIDFLKSFDPSSLLVTQGQDGKVNELRLYITDLLNHPNPMNDKATFCYNLTSSAAKVTITIYTIRGKRVQTITEASAKAGYNEEAWIAEDDNGRKLANGTYFYKMVAERDEEKVQKIDKLSIIR